MTFPDTIMPAFYIDTGYIRSAEKFEGKPILTAQQVEDVIAYLQTLTEISNESSSTIVFPLPMDLIEPIMGVAKTLVAGPIAPINP